MIRLQAAEVIKNLSAIVDPDPPMSCDLMDGRDSFLTLAREKHYEFSSLRRTKVCFKVRPRSWNLFIIVYLTVVNNGYAG